MSTRRAESQFLNRNNVLFFAAVVLTILLMAVVAYFYYITRPEKPPAQGSDTSFMTAAKAPARALWHPPDSNLIPHTDEGALIRYGKELIAHTARYLGPGGKVKRMSNGMNCQNCHLSAGTKPFGNNYAAVASTYPKFRARSGGMESMEKRINDCIQRSLNGQKLADESREMRAIIAWFQWLGKDVPRDSVPPGTGLTTLSDLERAADPVKGKKVYEKHCLVCHGTEGAGLKHPDSLEWTYPPLAGKDSYTTAAGLFRLSRFAGYVKSNMPHGTTFEKPVLSDEEAWDVAAYINSLPRPVKVFAEDWPDISKKPFDHPFGPYADSFPESQHKYGPFKPIRLAQKPKSK